MSIGVGLFKRTWVWGTLTNSPMGLGQCQTSLMTSWLVYNVESWKHPTEWHLYLCVCMCVREKETDRQTLRGIRVMVMWLPRQDLRQSQTSPYLLGDPGYKKLFYWNFSIRISFPKSLIKTIIILNQNKKVSVSSSVGPSLPLPTDMLKIPPSYNFMFYMCTRKLYSSSFPPPSSVYFIL